MWAQPAGPISRSGSGVTGGSHAGIPGDHHRHWAGWAGLGAAIGGWRIAGIERKLFGGTCHNTGCTPTKTLIASAYAAHVARRAADYGVNIGGKVTVDMKAVKARKDAVVGPTPNGIERSLKALRGCTVYQDHARFVGPNEVKTGDAVLKADKIFIDVGGRALVPPIPGLDQIPYLTNSSMMEVDFLPPHLIVLGGSY